MYKILGYGEDAFTLWALKHRIADILEAFQDQTNPLDCEGFSLMCFDYSRKVEGNFIALDYPLK